MQDNSMSPSGDKFHGDADFTFQQEPAYIAKSTNSYFNYPELDWPQTDLT